MKRPAPGILIFAILLMLTLAYFGSYLVMGRHSYRVADPPHNRMRVFGSSRAELFFTPAAKLEGLLTRQQVFTHWDDKVEDYY